MNKINNTNRTGSTSSASKKEKKKFPNEEEVVLCTVTKIFPSTVFCNLDEYGKEGVIPISEIAPGRIRNIRDYVKEGKKVVCRVLAVEPEKSHITFSLRRVTLNERKKKLEEHEKEKKSQTILKIFSQKAKIKINERVLEKVREKYGSLFDFFQTVLDDKSKLNELDIKNEEELYELIKERVKSKKVKIKVVLELHSNLPDGVEKIKKVLNIKGVTVKYIAAPIYQLEIEAEKLKEAEKFLRGEAEKVISDFKPYGEAKIKEKV